jgi:uncharacterized protein YbdZ (MbtH family)
MSADEDDVTYAVVVNDEEQYSIWPQWSEPPAGWRAVGRTGSRKDCLDHIDAVWTDMRPLSLRRRLEELASQPELFETLAPAADEGGTTLVGLLSQGEHPLRVCTRPEATAARLKQAIDAGVVLVRFTDTRGETELAVPLDRAACDLSSGDFDAARGTVHLVGSLVLDGEAVTCRADVDLSTLAGSGRLAVSS